jgi:hypothetical protein
VPGDYQLNITRYVPAESKLGSNTVYLDIDAGQKRQFIVREAPAGAYVFQDIGRQYKWAVCFHDNSVSFELNPGEVVYLGLLDPRVNLLQLEQLAVTSGRTTASSGTIHHFLEGIKPPALMPATEADLGDIRSYLHETSPLVTAPVRVASLQPARFGAGRDLFGLQASCGGWYTGSAKPKE